MTVLSDVDGPSNELFKNKLTARITQAKTTPHCTFLGCVIARARKDAAFRHVLLLQCVQAVPNPDAR